MAIRARRALCEVVRRIPRRGNDVTLTALVAPREMRWMRSCRRRIAMTRVARGRSLLVTGQARRSTRVATEVLTVAALTHGQVIATLSELFAVCHRKPRRVDALNFGTNGSLAFDRAASEQRYDDEPLHRWCTIPIAAVRPGP